MRRRTIGIPLEFGFHEIKKFVHSGLVQKLSSKFDIVWLALRKNSVEFDEIFRSTGFPIVYFEQDDLPKSYLKVERLDRLVRNSWMLNQGIGSFHNYRKISQRTFSSTILGNSLLKNILGSIVLRMVKNFYFNQKLATVYSENNIHAVFSISYNTSFSKSIFVTAFHKNIDTWYLVNSWKDLYVDNTVAFDFPKGIFVWSDEMRKAYIRHIAHLKDMPFYVVGNPSFDPIVISDPVYTRDYYAKKYSLPLNAQWIYYTMMPPGLVNDEIETIKAVGNELLRRWSADEKIILIRRNPNHHKTEFNDVSLPPNVVLTEHFIVYDKVTDMIVQSSEGESEWVDLLHHTAANLSVPSTVTLEFLVKGKPIINIRFGPTGQIDQRIDQHFEADFYKPLFLRKDVLECCELKDIHRKVMEVDNLIGESQIQPTAIASEKIESILSTFYNDKA